MVVPYAAVLHISTIQYTLQLSGTPCFVFVRNFLPGNAGLPAVAVAVAVAGLKQAARQSLNARKHVFVMTRIYRCRPFSGRGRGRRIETGSKAITERTQTCFCDDADLPLTRENSSYGIRAPPLSPPRILAM
jgi:hypothetical protein